MRRYLSDTVEPITSVNEVIPHSLPELALTDEEWQSISTCLRLTCRESQIVRSLLNGNRESEIGDELGIHASTVHTHLKRLHRKLKVRDRCGLVVRVFNEYISLASTAPSHAQTPHDDRADYPN